MPAHEQRFWARVDTSAGPDECWPWRGSCDPSGYGAYSIFRKKINTHRYALQLKLGRPVKGLACHSCDNRICCNPLHLHEGTYKSNMEECKSRGRTRTGGDNITRAKLTPDLVREIRALRFHLSQREVAKRYGLGKTTVARLQRGETWKHVI